MPMGCWIHADGCRERSQDLSHCVEDCGVLSKPFRPRMCSPNGNEVPMFCLLKNGIFLPHPDPGELHPSLHPLDALKAPALQDPGRIPTPGGNKPLPEELQRGDGNPPYHPDPGLFLVFFLFSREIKGGVEEGAALCVCALRIPRSCSREGGDH